MWNSSRSKFISSPTSPSSPGCRVAEDSEAMLWWPRSTPGSTFSNGNGGRSQHATAPRGGCYFQRKKSIVIGFLLCHTMGKCETMAHTPQRAFAMMEYLSAVASKREHTHEHTHIHTLTRPCRLLHHKAAGYKRLSTFSPCNFVHVSWRKNKYL